MEPNTSNTKMATLWALFASMMILVAGQAFAQDSGSQEIRFGVMHLGSQTMRVNAVNTNNPGTAPVSVRLRILDSTGKIMQELVTNLPTAEGSQVASVEFTPGGKSLQHTPGTPPPGDPSCPSGCGRGLYATVLIRGSHPDTDYIRATCEIVLRKGNDEETIALYPGVAVPCDSVPCTE